MREAPDELNRMVDVVLAYKPPAKTKAAKKRKRKKTALQKKEEQHFEIRESSI